MAELKQYSQTDPAWKAKLLGFDKTSTLGNFGCLLTSVSMLASAYGVNETPDSLNEKMKKVAGFSAGTAFMIPGAIPAAMPGIRYVTYVNCSNAPAPLAEIDAWLGRGRPGYRLTTWLCMANRMMITWFMTRIRFRLRMAKLRSRTRNMRKSQRQKK